MTFSLHEAKAKLSELVSLAEAGETIEITRHGKLVARLTGANFEPRTPGSGKGSFRVIGGWENWEFTEHEIDAFYDSPMFPNDRGSDA